MSLISNLFSSSYSQAFACEEDVLIKDTKCFPVDSLSHDLKKRMYLEEESKKYGVKKEKFSSCI